MGGTGLKRGSDVAEKSGKGAVSGAQNQDFRVVALDYLKESVNLCVRELRNPRARGKTKMKWAHCLAQQIAALVNLCKVVGVKDEDLAVWLSKVDEKVPKKYRDVVWFGRRKQFGKTRQV